MAIELKGRHVHAAALGRPARAALIDEQPYVREGVAAVLGRHHDVQLVTAVPDVNALAAHTGVPPDVVVLDLNLSADPSGPPAVARVRALGYPVLLLTAETDPRQLLTAVEEGARGILDKSGDVTALGAAILAVAAGESLVTPAVAARMQEHAKASSQLTLPPALADVLRLLALGLDNQTIASRRHVSVSTVKKQIREIRDIYASAGIEIGDRANLCGVARQGSAVLRAL